MFDVVHIEFGAIQKAMDIEIGFEFAAELASGNVAVLNDIHVLFNNYKVEGWCDLLVR